MAQPTFRRFWVKILPDGRALPQFDPVTGKSHEVDDYTGPMAQLLFHPVTRTLSEKIKTNNDQAEPSKLKILSYEFQPGDEVQFYRVGNLRIDHVKVCGFCGASFDFEDIECPRCMAKIEWYCGECDKLKKPLIDTILVNSSKDTRMIKIVPALQKWAWKIAEQLPGHWAFHDIQARCPECEKTNPRGLKTVECVANAGIESLYTHYVLIVNGKKTLIMDYKITR